MSICPIRQPECRSSRVPDSTGLGLGVSLPGPGISGCASLPSLRDLMPFQSLTPIARRNEPRPRDAVKPEHVAKPPVLPSRLRYAAQQAVNHTNEGKTVTLLQTTELGPRHMTGSASPRQLASPDPSRSLPEFLEAEVVSSDPVIPVVASQLLHELPVPFLDRSV
jgi:hypothetical protein